jgi:hypothetical protein
MSETTATDTQQTAEYEHLRRKRKETEGTIELAEVVDVWVGETEVVCRFQFDWAGDPIRRTYDLDDDRDIAKLETLCETNGLDFEQLPHLEGTLLELRYTGSRWEPTATDAYTKNEGTLIETFRAECHLLAREIASSPAFVRNGIERIRGLSMTQTIIAVLLVKKLIIIALLAYVML